MTGPQAKEINVMKTKGILIAAAAVLMVASAVLAGDAGDAHRDRHFAQLDTNGDGVLSKEEFNQGLAMHRRGPGGPGGPDGEGHPRIGGFFVYSADADRNHEVTEAEWDSFLDRALGKDGRLSAEELTALFPMRRSADERPHHAEHAEHLERFLDHLDRDGNDVVDAADFNAIFAQLDEDDNGTIEATEFGHHGPHRGPRR